MGARASRVVAFAVGAPIDRSDLPALCDRVCALLDESRADVALCDVTGVEADAVTVEALARLQVAARRHGCLVRLRHASEELCELIAFMGLRDVLPGCVTIDEFSHALPSHEGDPSSRRRQR